MKSVYVKLSKAYELFFLYCCMHFKLFKMKLCALLYALKRGVKFCLCLYL